MPIYSGIVADTSTEAVAGHEVDAENRPPATSDGVDKADGRTVQQDPATGSILANVCNHLGKTAMRAENSIWYKMNDESFNVISKLDEVLKSEAYILLYQRCCE